MIRDREQAASIISHYRLEASHILTQRVKGQVPHYSDSFFSASANRAAIREEKLREKTRGENSGSVTERNTTTQDKVMVKRQDEME